MKAYQHTQVGYLILYLMIGCAFVALVAGFASTGARVEISIAVILLLTAILFSSLTITIDGDSLRASFGPGLIARRIKLTDIASCEPIRIRWWYGWGIRLTPYGWLYNVSGFDAVVVTLRNGRRAAFGTDQPVELTAAIRLAASVK